MNIYIVYWTKFIDGSSEHENVSAFFNKEKAEEDANKWQINYPSRFYNIESIKIEDFPYSKEYPELSKTLMSFLLSKNIL